MPKPSQPQRKIKVDLCSYFEQPKIASCLLCMESCTAPAGICDQCLMDLPVLNTACEKCREPLQLGESGNNNLLCAKCQKTKRLFNDCIAGLIYQPPVSNMLQRIKYSGRIVYLKPLTQHFKQELNRHYCERPWPETLIPVPMHWWKQRVRGFNQANLIAKDLSKSLDIPFLDRHIRRTHNYPPQFGLSAPQRRRNIRHAFSVRRKISSAHVAIIDDVMTTGATAEELCKVLLNHGVKTVDVWCIARTPPYC